MQQVLTSPCRWIKTAGLFTVLSSVLNLLWDHSLSKGHVRNSPNQMIEMNGGGVCVWPPDEAAAAGVSSRVFFSDGAGSPTISSSSLDISPAFLV